jgi:hypothetical protein
MERAKIGDEHFVAILLTGGADNFKKNFRFLKARWSSLCPHHEPRNQCLKRKEQSKRFLVVSGARKPQEEIFGSFTRTDSRDFQPLFFS